MNKEMKHRYSTQILKRVFIRYIVTVLCIVVVLLGGLLLARKICLLFVWQPQNPVYLFLKDVQTVAPYLIVFVTLVGAVTFTYLIIKRLLTYFDAMFLAAKKLSHPDEEPIKLPADILDVENELNLVREQSLRNMQATKDAEQRKNDLVVYLAHDLKTPLTSVIGYLSLLQEEPQLSTELKARYIGIALNKAERLEDLINEFFDITRFSLTKLSLDLERTNLSRMLEQITFEFIPILSEKELSWQLEISPEVEVLCDRDKFGRVLDNLIRNAVNYSYSNSSIQLQLEQTKEEVKLVLSNHGKTISAEKLERIFDQFFRLDSSRSSSNGGAGLGLAIAKEIVEQHGGKIYATSEQECITFTIILPNSLS